MNWQFSNYRQIFAQRAYRSFWLGFTFSNLGDAMTRVALTWFVYESTHSAEALGVLMLCYTGPVVIGGLVAGSLLDRFDRRTVMIADNVIRGLGVALIPLLNAFGQLALWEVYLVAALYGLLMMISLAGSPALIPDLVSADQLATANALETLSFMLGGIAGPVIAGWLIGSIGAPNVVIVDAVSYFAFAFALLGIRHQSIEAKYSEQSIETFTLKHSVQLLFKNKVLLSTTLMFMAANIGAGFLFVWLPILSDQTLHGGSELFGFLLGILSLGEVLSAFVSGSLSLPIALGALICIAQFLSGAALILVLLGQNLFLIALGLFLFGAFSSPLTIWAQTLRMKVIPERLRGRTFALLRMLMQSGNPIGGAVAGGLIPIVGLPIVIGLSAAMVGVPGVIGYGVQELRTDTVGTLSTSNFG